MSLTIDISPMLGHAARGRLRTHAESVMARPPDEIIGDAYLRRWHVAKGRAWSYYVHLYVGDDPAPWLHDHPWPSLSLCLQGSLHEHGLDRRGRACRAAITPGILAWRPARFAHRLDLTASRALTLFVAGPRIREWGWRLPEGWRPWHEVSRVDSDGVTRTTFPSRTPSSLPSRRARPRKGPKPDEPS